MTDHWPEDPRFATQSNPGAREGRAARPMTGSGPIVIRLENDPRYYEHASIINAVAEAERLRGLVGGTFVVYAPVKIIPPPRSDRE